MVTPLLPIKPLAIVGLGNPEAKLAHTRHNVGFQIVDGLAARYGGQWHIRKDLEIAIIEITSQKVHLIKPQTYMNNSGDVVPYFKKEDFKPVDVLVVHDDLELPFGKVSLRVGGSAKGHNGLKSIIDRWGTTEFARLRFGIGRPEDPMHVPQYVLHNFENPTEAQLLIEEAIDMIVKLYS